jgi:hypothetical protein
VEKKKLKKIVLSKETLRHLEDGKAHEIKGGAFSQFQGCTGSCYNSCPKTCDC